ncbi:hypothetical protein [Methylorubrum extorquens]|uniref:hypothetical protein n=1 Tax=Methylorubrum extorquens TaxID=408 RepID=UPI000158F510|nr:hypothetical protein [Methylorubrum extorquens]ABY28579.1 hypothetical protein Mext_0153 [Methylorubrum extorquens PA1]KQP85678.1 hypothetical protein ASF55_15120 [Methylobacterium sp. Leaf119]WIU39959.1 hypothetical protein KQ926_00800 [Methylorubrum extorquens]
MQTYSLKQDGGPGAFTVVVDREMVGRVIACDEHPGLWRIQDQNGRFMGRAGMREQSAEFLAAWFVAEDQDWT